MTFLNVYSDEMSIGVLLVCKSNGPHSTNKNQDSQYCSSRITWWIRVYGFKKRSCAREWWGSRTGSGTEMFIMLWIYMTLAYSHTEPCAGYSQADVIGQRHVDTEGARVVEKLSQHHLTLRGWSHVITLQALNRTCAVSVRHHGAHLTRKAEEQI